MRPDRMCHRVELITVILTVPEISGGPCKIPVLDVKKAISRGDGSGRAAALRSVLHLVAHMYVHFALQYNFILVSTVVSFL